MRLKILVSLSAIFLASACASVSEPSAPSVAADPVPAAPRYALSDFDGADGPAVDALLGAPALVRREGAGEYRRYALTGCTLIIILYPDETGVQRVAHVDATAATSAASRPDLESCLATG